MDSAKTDYLAVIIIDSANFPPWNDLHLFLAKNWDVKDQIKMLKYDW